MRLAASIRVDAPLDHVWDFFLDPRNLARWDRSVARVEITSAEPLGLGSTFDTLSPARAGRTPLRTSYRITRVEDHRRADVEVTHSNLFRQATWETHMAPCDGGTEVTSVVHFKLKPRYWLLAPLVALTRGAIVRDLGYLKTELEAPAAEAA